MISFDIYQREIPPAHRFSRARLAKLSHALAQCIPEQTEGKIDVSFISDQEIRRLNRMYRGKDKVTDVLSFGSANKEVSGHLGDVLISFPQAVRQAEEGDITLELADLLVHGILHLLGYDHERPEDANVMFPLQDAIVSKIL